MGKICGIYKITNIVNNKVYIGCSTNIDRRIKKHKSLLMGGNHFNKHLQLSYNKYGKENFIFEIVEKCEESVLYAREDFYAEIFKSLNSEYGYNKLPTSENKRPKHLTQEIKDKIGNSNRGRPSKKKGKKSEKTTGEKHPLYGKPNFKLIEYNKIRYSLGQIHPNLGKKLTEKHVEIIRKRNTGNTFRRKEVHRYNKNDGNYIDSFPSAYHAQESLNILQNSICNTCNKKTKFAGKYYWSYIKTENYFAINL
jgi:group I intron endonuclease